MPSPLTHMPACELPLACTDTALGALDGAPNLPGPEDAIAGDAAGSGTGATAIRHGCSAHGSPWRRHGSA